MRAFEILTAGPYNAAFAVAVGFGLFLAYRRGLAEGHRRDAWILLLASAITGGIVGSKLIFFDLQPAEPGEVSNLGGMALGVTTVLVMARATGIRAGAALDTLASPTLVAMAIGRLGCFVAGCCRGVGTSLPWGVRYGNDPHPVHPVQLYEAAADLILVAALSRLTTRRAAGWRFAVTIAGYAGIRVTTEFFRAGRTEYLGLNPVQWIVAALGATAGAWALHHLRGAAPSPTRQVAQRLAAGPWIQIALAAVLAVSVLAFDAWFTSIEVLVLAVVAGVLASVGVLGHAAAPSRRLAGITGLASVRLAPSLGILMLLQAPVVEPERPRRQIVVRGSIARAAYDRVIGHHPPTTSIGTDCNGNPTTEYHAGAPVRADRRASTQVASVALRQPFGTTGRFTVEVAMLSTSDQVVYLDAGPQDAPVTDVRARAAGGSMMLEGSGVALRVGAFAGTLNRWGATSREPALSAMLRLGADRGVFFEGAIANENWHSTVGEFSYAGIGGVFPGSGGRFVVGGSGDGFYAGTHLPIRGFELDLALRIPTRSPEFRPVGNWTIGLALPFGIR